VISIIFIILAGICNACMDVVSFRWFTCVFCNGKPANERWFNPSLSWKNKWKPLSTTEERFFGSSTIFVFLTDFWHLCKFLMLLFITGAIVFYHPIINWWGDLLLIYSIFTVIFELFFSKILIRKG
jgi:hypothetical protein